MTLIEIASLFEERKTWLVSAADLSKDALHIYFGLTLFLCVRLIWRWSGGWLVAWIAVLAMACGGEFLDMTAEASRAAIQPDAAHWHDIWNTMFWPTVLLITGRWLQPAARADTPAPNALSGENATPSGAPDIPSGEPDTPSGEPDTPSGENAERRFEQA